MTKSDLAYAELEKQFENDDIEHVQLHQIGDQLEEYVLARIAEAIEFEFTGVLPEDTGKGPDGPVQLSLF